MPASFPTGHEDQSMREMNTTPLIDVMLVLLIMFIITMPMQTHAVKMDLPSQSKSLSEPDPVRNRITIDPAGTVRWNGTVVDRAMLRRYLDKVVRMPMQPALELEPHAQARYEAVDAVLADIKHAGATHVGFVGNENYKSF
jgi:biopolymer transport protein ExbD